MAFQIGKDLAPRSQAPNSQKILSSNLVYGHNPVKLAGLFAAMELSLSAGAVNPSVSKELHREDLAGNVKDNGKRSVSFDSTKNTLLYFTNALSSLNPALVSASALLPAFVNPPIQELRGDEEDGGEASSNAERREEESGDAAPTNGITTSLSSLPTSPIAHSIVEMSAMSLFGEKFKLDYNHGSANVNGRTEKVFRTRAPRPRIHHDNSISESGSVSAATGLYRTIVGEVPRFFTMQDDLTVDEVDELSPETYSSLSGDLNFYCTCASDVDEHVVSAKVDDNEPTEINNNHQVQTDNVVKKSLIRRTSSKFRRQKQVEIDVDDEVFEPDCHRSATRRNFGSVKVLKNRRTQMPITYSKSLDSNVQAFIQKSFEINHENNANNFHENIHEHNHEPEHSQENNNENCDENIDHHHYGNIHEHNLENIQEQSINDENCDHLHHEHIYEHSHENIDENCDENIDHHHHANIHEHNLENIQEQSINDENCDHLHHEHIYEHSHENIDENCDENIDHHHHADIHEHNLENIHENNLKDNHESKNEKQRVIIETATIEIKKPAFSCGVYDADEACITTELFYSGTSNTRDNLGDTYNDSRDIRNTPDQNMTEDNILTDKIHMPEEMPYGNLNSTSGNCSDTSYDSSKADGTSHSGWEGGRSYQKDPDHVKGEFVGHNQSWIRRKRRMSRTKEVG